MLGTTKRRALWSAIGALSCMALVAGASVARADESSGRWTGQVSLWGNYYWETSTRVVAPSVAARITSPEGVDIRAEYLVDAITSASVAAGVITDIRFTEVRNQFSLGTGHEFDLGDTQLRLDLNTRVSHEPDYLATGVSMSGSLSMAERCSVLGWSLGYIHDDVGAVIRGGQPRVGDDGRDLSNRGRLGELEGLNASVSFSQILSPVHTLSVGYDFVHNWGFLANPYRQVMMDGVLRPEQHPGTRTRHSLYGRFAWYVPESGTAFHLMYRAYVDDWDVAALTPEVRVYQELGSHATLRLRYRYYDQLQSYFWNRGDAFEGDTQLLTADPKMDDFDSHLFGVRALVRLGFLEGTFLDFMHEGNLQLNFDYWVQSSRFGNGVISQVGVEVPF